MQDVSDGCGPLHGGLGASSNLDHGAETDPGPELGLRNGPVQPVPRARAVDRPQEGNGGREEGERVGRGQEYRAQRLGDLLRGQGQPLHGPHPVQWFASRQGH